MSDTCRENAELLVSQFINRSASAVAMQLSNFASVDPYHQQLGIKGLTGGIRQVQMDFFYRKRRRWFHVFVFDGRL
jgi:hypothetical protein